MRKIININFQGRVIPIEETAYDILKQYIESLRIFFADEEGKDEIINDIEGRIAELFSEALSKGAAAITDANVNTVINSIGRPEDFDDQETRVKEQLKGEETHRQQSSSRSHSYAYNQQGGLSRDQDDKILGGVCAGVANYFRIQPAIVRVLFVLLTFGSFGTGMLLYIILWLLLPVQKIDKSVIRQRLYRNPDDKVIAGVAGGLAAYFDVAVWIPRLFFVLPLVLTFFGTFWSKIFHVHIPVPFIFSSFGGTFLLIYVILWLVVPEANSASEKLEMKGEKVDLNSIKTTIQDDLDSFRVKAEKWGEEFKHKAQEWGDEVGTTFQTKGKQFSGEASYAGKNAGARVANVLGAVIKGFFLFIAGMIAFALIVGLVGLFAGGFTIAPFTNFFLGGFWQNVLAVATVVLFIAVPVIGLITWIIRRIIGVRSGKRSYLGLIFGGLWTIGWICLFILVPMIISEYRSENGVQEQVSVSQPSGDKIKLTAGNYRRTIDYGRDWFGWNKDDDYPFISDDTMLLRSVKVWIFKSPDSAYHLEMVKFSRGPNKTVAKEYASQINFGPVEQNDSTLTLPNTFAISSHQKFRNQQVLLKLSVPVGKRVEMHHSINRYEWFSSEYDEDWEHPYDWNSDVEYMMTEKGLRSVHSIEKEARQNRGRKEKEADKLRENKRKQQELIEEQKELESKLKDSMKTVQTHLILHPTKLKKQQVQPAAYKLADLLPRPSGLLLMRLF